MAGYEYKNVKVTLDEGIAWVMLNRPEKRNAMSPELAYEMEDALNRLEFDAAAKVVVIGGEGGNFSAGQDLKTFFKEVTFNPAAKAEARKAARSANMWRWERIIGYDKPTIAMVNGYCIGGAFAQLCACDISIAAENATFCLSEVNWGIIPGGIISKVVADRLLPAHALYLACLGEPIDGKEAVRIGLVNVAVPEKKLKEATTDLAKRLMKKSPNVLRATKQAIRSVRTMDYQQSVDYLGAKIIEMMAGDKEDSNNEGIRQFLDKKYRPTFEPFKLREDRGTEK